MVVVIEAADKHRSVGSHRISHGDSGVLESMIHIFHHQPLLWVECQELVLGDVEERPVEIGGILGEEMTSLDMELNDVQYLIISHSRTETPTVPPCSGSG